MDFNLDPDIIYLNHAAVSPWPRRTVNAVKAFADENGRLGASDYPGWLEAERTLRGRLARLINAPSPEEIALLKNTSEGLSLIAYGIEWRAGENVVSIAQEFPSNRIVWESLQRFGVKLRLLDLSATDEPEQALIELCDARTRLISVSSVQYATGLKLNLKPLGEYCRANGVLFCVDAIQSLGAIPFDVAENLADLVVADGHKWMLGPEGLALFYCRAELREQLRLHQYGWHMVEQAGNFDRTTWQPAASATRFECGSPNMLAIHALNASLELLLELGIDRVQQHIAHNTATIVEEVERLGFDLLTPHRPDRRGGIVSFSLPDADNQATYRSLMQKKVICAFRGGGIRFSPHYYNSREEIQHAFSFLSKQRYT